MSGNSNKRKSSKPDAIRVVSKGAAIPPPSTELMLEVTMGLHLAVTHAAALSIDSPEPPVWDELSDSTKDMWLAGARIAYGVIAIHGGGKVERVSGAK